MLNNNNKNMKKLLLIIGILSATISNAQKIDLSTSWQWGGSSPSSYSLATIGTKNLKSLLINTNGITRIKIDSLNGSITTFSPLISRSTLSVTGNSTLTGIQNNGNTVITGTLGVVNVSVSSTSTLTGLTNNGTMFVSSTSTLTGVVNNGNSTNTGSITGTNMFLSSTCTVQPNSKIGNNYIASIITATATLDFVATGPSSATSLTMTCTGAVEGDIVILGLPTTAYPILATSYNAYVSAANIVTIIFGNFDGGSQNPPSTVYKVAIIKN